MTTEQVYGAFGDTEHTCGIGAAQVAFGDRPGDAKLRTILETPMLIKGPCGHNYSSLSNGIMHLNDNHQWPRHKIADWLEKEGL